MRSAGGASSHLAISVREGQVTSWESLVLVLARQKGEVGLGKVSWQSLGGFRARAFFCKNCLGMFIRTWDQISFLSCTFLYLRVASWVWFVCTVYSNHRKRRVRQDPKSQSSGCTTVPDES